MRSTTTPPAARATLFAAGVIKPRTYWEFEAAADRYVPLRELRYDPDLDRAVRATTHYEE